MTKVEEEVIKKVIQEGIKGTLLSTVAGTVAGQATKHVSLRLGKDVLKNSAVGALTGSLLGGATTSLLSEVVKVAPTIATKVVETLGYGGYERGTIAGAEKILTILREAPLLPMLGYLGEIISYNPNTRALKNAILVTGSAGIVYAGTQKLLEVILAHQTSTIVKDTLRKQITFQLESCLAKSKFNLSVFNRFNLELAACKDEVALRKLLDNLSQY